MLVARYASETILRLMLPRFQLAVAPAHHPALERYTQQSDNSALTARVVVSRGVIIADAAAVASLFYLRRARAAGLICYDPALSTVCCHIARHR
jgi:hypothetical protein